MTSTNSSALANTTTTTATSTPMTSAEPERDGLAAWSWLTRDITQTKLIASPVLFVITLLVGYLPVRIILNQNYIQHAMFAGGGVLMATAFCHLMPEAHDGYRNSHSAHHLHSHAHSHSHVHSRAGAPDEHRQPHLHPVIESNASATNAFNDTDSAHQAHADADSAYVPYPEIALCCGFIFMYIVEQLFLSFVNNHTHEHPGDTSTGQLIGSQQKRLSSGDIDKFASCERESASVTIAASGAGLANSPGPTALYKFVRGLLIVSAFSMHSIFDGVAIGSQDSVEKVWTIFFAISCHKLIIVAVVGFELYSATLESHLWTLFHLTLFSIMSPIGILLVILAQSSLKVSSDDPVMILLQSFATGTLLYIIFVEILQPKEDRFHTRNRPTKILCLIVGFGLMLAVLTFMSDGA